jgi:hypothetical protein
MSHSINPKIKLLREFKREYDFLRFRDGEVLVQVTEKAGFKTFEFIDPGVTGKNQGKNKDSSGKESK